MINIIKQEMPFEKTLKQRLEFICEFCKTTPTFINGSIRKISKNEFYQIDEENAFKYILDKRDALTFRKEPTPIEVKPANEKVLNEIYEYEEEIRLS